MFSFLAQCVNTFFPLVCYGCNVVVGTEGLCSACWTTTHRIGEKVCILCGAPADGVFYLYKKMVCPRCHRDTPVFHTHRALWAYGDVIKKIIFSLKYDHQHYIAEWIAAQMVPKVYAIPDVTCLIAVPLHSKKLKKRGFNQAALIAKKLAKKTGIPYAPDGLRRLWNTPSQGRKSWTQRYDNVHGAFMSDGVTGNVIVIDDVYTTGATLNACAHALMDAGAAQVHALTIAHLI